MSSTAGGSVSRWGRGFGAQAAAWGKTWEGPAVWGTRVYEHVLGRTEIGVGVRVLGWGAGRLAR
jgi:hypothetical protein